MTHLILDGTLIESDRLAGVRDNGNDLWSERAANPSWRRWAGSCPTSPTEAEIPAPECG
jgi:hypothetical protein